MQLSKGAYYGLILGAIATHAFDALVVHYENADGVFSVDVYGSRTSRAEAKDAISTLMNPGEFHDSVSKKQH